MAEEATQPEEGKDAPREAEEGQELGSDQVTEAMQKEQEQGYRGTVPDPTPNENYAAVNSTPDNDLPTPETDRELYDESRAAAYGNPHDNVEKTSTQTKDKS